jgi:predicted nucleic acid-binding protein
MTIDTNILIAYLGGESLVINQIQQWRFQNIPLFISSITECELLSFPKLTKSEEEKINELLKESFIVFPFDSLRARQAAKIRREIPTLKLPDAAIAALALEMNTPLVTRNIKDCKKIPNLKLLKI